MILLYKRPTIYIINYLYEQSKIDFGETTKIIALSLDRTSSSFIGKKERAIRLPLLHLWIRGSIRRWLLSWCSIASIRLPVLATTSQILHRIRQIWYKQTHLYNFYQLPQIIMDICMEREKYVSRIDFIYDQQLRRDWNSQGKRS